MKNPPVHLSFDSRSARRFATLSVASVAAMFLVLLLVHSTRSPEQVAQSVANQPEWMPAWFMPWGLGGVLAVMSLLVWVLITRARSSAGPRFTVTGDGITINRDALFGRPAPAPYHVPWDHVTAIRRAKLNLAPVLYVELVSDHRALHAASLGLSGWPARKETFLSPVISLGHAQVPTVVMSPDSLGVPADDLQAMLEKYRSDALLADGRRPAVPRR